MTVQRRTRPAPSPGWATHRPPDWQLRGLCRWFDRDLWFPDKGGSTADAKEVCGRCPVRELCLEYAIENDIRHGIWGGLAERPRLQIRLSRMGPKYPVKTRAPRSHPKRTPNPVRVDCPCSQETCGGRVSEKTRRRHLAADRRRDVTQAA